MNSSLGNNILNWLSGFWNWLGNLLHPMGNIISHWWNNNVMSIYHAHASWINIVVIVAVLLILGYIAAMIIFKQYIVKKSPIYKEIVRINNEYPFYNIPRLFVLHKDRLKRNSFETYTIDQFALEEFRNAYGGLTQFFEAAALNRYQLESYVHALHRIKMPLMVSAWPSALRGLFQNWEKKIYTDALAYPNINPNYLLRVRLNTSEGKRRGTHKEIWCDQAYMEKLYKRAKHIPDSRPTISVEQLLRQEAAKSKYQLSYSSRLPNSSAERAQFVQQRNSAIPPKMRYQVLMRDGQRCAKCGKAASAGVVLDVYHKVPVAQGGTTEPVNLWTLCDNCSSHGNTYRHVTVRPVKVDSTEFERIQRARMTPKYKEEIKQRDGYRCQICGRGLADGVKLEVDHIKPVSKGGTSDPENLRTLCWDCNRGKGKDYNPYGAN